jgi:hypothetical protein
MNVVAAVKIKSFHPFSFPSIPIFDIFLAV